MSNRGVRPRTLAYLCLAGSFMLPVITGLLRVMLPENLRGSLSELDAHGVQLRLLVSIPLFCAGAVYLVATFYLWRGVRRNLWSEDELANVRQWFECPMWFGIISLSFLSACIALIYGISTGLPILLMVPGQAVLQLKGILKPKTMEQRSILGL